MNRKWLCATLIGLGLLAGCSSPELKQCNISTTEINSRFAYPDTFQTSTIQTEFGQLHVGSTNLQSSTSVILLPGLEVPMELLGETVRDVTNLGANIYTLDWPYQGRSYRASNPQKISPNDFEEYLAAFDNAFHTFNIDVRKSSSDKLVIVGSSMGGHLALRWANRHPEVEIDEIILLAPALGLAGQSETVVGSLTNINRFIGNGNGYVMGQGPWNASSSQDDCGRSVSTYLPRSAAWHVMLTENEETRVGGPTWNWMSAFYRSLRQLRSVEEFSNVGQITIFYAENDDYVSNELQLDYCDRFENCSAVLLVGSKHDMLLETDTIRTPVLNAIRDSIDGFSE